MTVQSFAQLNALKIGPKKKYGIQLMTGSKTWALEQNNYSQKYSAQKNHEKKVVSELTICHQKWTKIVLIKIYSPAGLSTLKNRVGNRM